MSNIVVFGAGGRAGRSIVAEARSRGHKVVAVVRDPDVHPALDAVAGDVTICADVSRLVDGADVVVNASARMDISATEFYTSATRALVDGVGTRRLVLIGIGTMLEAAPGERLMDAPDFPLEAKAFSDGHVAELELLQASDVDWVVVTPPPVLLDEAPISPTTRRIEAGPALLESNDPDFSFADLGAATVDVIESDEHHRTQVAAARA